MYGRCAVFWMDGGWKADEADAPLESAWELLVELRTGFPEIRYANSIGDKRMSARCLERLVAKAGRLGPILCGWPNLARDVAEAAAQLKSNPADADAWLKLESLADELEEGIANATMRRNTTDEAP